MGFLCSTMHFERNHQENCSTTFLRVILLPLSEPLEVYADEVDDGELCESSEGEEETDKDVNIKGCGVSYLIENKIMI